MRLHGKTAIITGAADGIGRGIAIKFAKEGADSLLVDLNRAGVEETARLAGAHGYTPKTMVADVSDRSLQGQIIQRAVDEFGVLDILVNNAGVVFVAPFQDFPVDKLHRIMEVNLKAPFLLAQHAARYWIANKRGGRIVSTSSINAESIQPNSAAYAASKGAIRMLTKAMAFDLGPHNITCNAVGPGHTRTGMTRPGLAADPNRERLNASVIPMRRIGEPEDIANAVAFLASDEASYVTGQTIYVEGGRIIWA